MLRESAALLIASLCFAQVLTTGPQVTTFLSDVDDSDQPYALYVPRDFDSHKKYPLVISLHGADSNHRINLRRVFGAGNRLGESDLEATRHFPNLKSVEFIVASPFARGTMGYQGIAEKDVYDVLADVKRRFPVDEDRVYLTGLSMGGGGTLWLGLTRPDVWAALAVVCPAPPPDLERLAGNAVNLPVKLFQGELDPTVPPAQTRSWHKLLLNSGVQAEYVEYPGIRHNSWDVAYKDGSIFPWFAKFKRNRTPDHVQFATADYDHNKAYWVEFDRLTPGTLASIDAKFTGPNALEIRTKQLEGFTLSLQEHPKWNARLPLNVEIDGVKIRAAAKVLSFSRTGTGWVNRKAVLSALEKKRGAEGPIRQAISERHIYVYGTADGPGEQEVIRRREVANHAATWGTPRQPLFLHFQVKSDRAVTAEDWNSSSLILFGSPDTNTLVAQLDFASKLPFRLNPDAADYGMVVMTPTANGHYAVVSSGLPWWTRADQARRAGLPFISQAHNILLSFGDYIVFKGGLDNVVSEGLLDSEWRLPRTARTQLEASGAVRVR